MTLAQSGKVSKNTQAVDSSWIRISEERDLTRRNMQQKYGGMAEQPVGSAAVCGIAYQPKNEQRKGKGATAALSGFSVGSCI